MDSPKCPECLKDGELQQTYKVAGRAEFKCGTCKKTFTADLFSPMDYNWQTDPVGYTNYLKGMNIEIGAKIVS